MKRFMSLFFVLCSIMMLFGGHTNAYAGELTTPSGLAYSVERKKSQLETFGILTEILIVIGIIISVTLAKFVADNTTQLIVTLICGWFVWGYGIVLRIKVRKEIKELTKTL